jgi:hypothetical protein
MAIQSRLWESRDSAVRKARRTTYFLKSYALSAHAKLKDMLEEDALISSKLLISSPEEDLLQEPTQEMRLAYVSAITDFFTITHENSAGSYLEHGHKSTTTTSTRKASPRRKSTGKSGSTSSKGSKTVKSQSKKQGA